MPDIDYGPLNAALAKAQAAFPPINRDKTVTVQTKAGGSYTFKYAPLDSILAAVRKPLADNGLAVLQLLDEDVLVTSLLHSSGAMLSGRTPIPTAEGIQAYGSAITYLRRYAIQALLGIAAEEDDDGNQAAGNRATFGAKAEAAATEDGGLIGTAEVGKPPSDFELRMGPDGSALSFRLVQGRQSIKVVAHGPLADALVVVRTEVIGKRVTCWGTVTEEAFVKDGRTIAYRVLTLERIQTPDYILPAEPEHRQITPEEEAELTLAIGRV